ncbi:hypothetical protein JCM3766R1_006300 [Sporobolomyces carnicolor]
MVYEDAQIVGPATHDEIDNFLTVWKPSAQKPAPTGWIWCQLAQATSEKTDSGKPAEDSLERDSEFEREGQELVEALLARCTEIKETAPTRAKKGEKSQKALRDEEYASFGDKVKHLAQKYNVLSGKWLLFADAEAVDGVWSKIVKALADADGALAKTGVVKTAKVASISQGGESQVICVYVHDSWDKAAVGIAFKCLVEDLKLVSSAYKTILGIDSKHESGIKSSLYGKLDFLSKDEIDKALASPAKESLAKEVRKKTLEEEHREGLDDFDAVSDSDDEGPAQKRHKVTK